jgi:hypothetical protein
MKKYLRLFAALERIFGKGYVSRLMGKQSNVITLPDKQARKFLDTELNVMEASEGAVKKGIQDLETVISDTKRLSTLNDQELLTITNNAERLAVKVNPPAPPPAPTAKIIPFTNKPDPEDFATGGRVGMAGGGILKLAMKFFNDNNPVSAYKKYLKYVKETAQKDPAKLAPEVGGIVVGSELIHRGLRRKLKEVKEKNNENNSENFETDNRTEKAGGGVSQGLDYLTGIERRGYSMGTLIKRTLLMAETLSELKPEYLKKLRRLEGYLGSINMDSKGGEQAAKKTMDKINTLKQEYKVLEKDLFEKKQLDEFDITNRTNNAKGGAVSKGLDYLTGVERRGYAEGSVSQEGVIPGFTKLKNPDGAPGNYNEFMYEGPDGQIYGAGTYSSIAAGQYPNIYDPSKDIVTEQTTPTEDFSDYLNTTTINTNVQTTPTEDFSDYLNQSTDTSSNLAKYIAELKRIGFSPEDIAFRVKNDSVFNVTPEDALTPEIPSNNVLDQWKAHAEATQAMKGETGLDAIPEYGFQTGYDFQSKFPNLDPRIGAGLASGYQVLTEGLGMFNPNNPNFLNPAAAYKTALSDATKNIEGIMAFDQNLMTPEQQENRNKYLKSVGQNIVQQRFPTYQQDLENYRQRQAAVDPNALRNSYLQNLQNTSSFDTNQYQSQLRSNLNPKGNEPQGLDYLTGQQ